MNLQIISDLHLDFKDNYKWVLKNVNPVSDILLVAGDTCEYKTSKKEEYHDVFFNKWEKVIEVPGNHDYYGWHSKLANISQCFETYQSAHDIKGFSIINYVNNDIVELKDDIVIICSTLWSKISPEQYLIIKNGMNDYSEIVSFTIDKCNCTHKMSVGFLDRTLKEYKNKKCIILTHHLPLTNLISDRFFNSVLNEAYASDLTRFLYQHENIKYWIHGHSHDFLEVQYGETIFFRNPVGYVKYNEQETYKDRVISL